eukprot:364973-Chlamydomonas_euryale.AAC.5
MSLRVQFDPDSVLTKAAVTSSTTKSQLPLHLTGAAAACAQQRELRCQTEQHGAGALGQRLWLGCEDDTGTSPASYRNLELAT